jgi:hypothetical protein
MIFPGAPTWQLAPPTTGASSVPNGRRIAGRAVRYAMALVRMEGHVKAAYYRGCVL